MKKYILYLLVFASITALKAQSCISFYNGVTNDTEFKNAADRLCGYGIIPNSFNVSYMFDYIKRKDVAVLLYRTLFASGYSSLDNYPTPFVDLVGLTSEEKSAMLTMLYLEYPANNSSGETDGVSPLSRDYFNAKPQQGITNQEGMRMFFESFNYTLDWTGYDKNNGSTTNFYTDLTYNNRYYPYFKTAYVNNLYANNTSGCGGSSCCPNGLMTVRNAYVILDKFILALSNWRLNPTNYFTPNTFTKNSMGNAVNIDRGVFSHYEDKSFSIKGGGLPLEFTHSYFSSFTELPRYDLERSSNVVEFQKFCPLGNGWTHTYNIYVQEIESTFTAERRLYFWWNDGTQDIYNYTTSMWESLNGKYNQINIVAGLGGGTYIDTIWLTQKNHLRYKFVADRSTSSFNLIEIRDRNDNIQTLTYEIGNNLGTNYTPTRLKTVTDNVSNRSLIFTYLPSSNLIDNVIDNSGRTVYFMYDFANLDLSKYTDAEGGNYLYTYGQNPFDKHLIKSITKPKGNTIYADYFNRKLKQTQSNNYVTKVDFQPNYANTSISTNTKITITQNGQTLEKNIKHTDKGLPSIIHDSSQYLVYFYEDVSNPTLPSKVLDINRGINYTFTYDSRGNVLTKRKSSNNGLFQEEKYQYSSLWNVTKLYTDPKGNTTEYLIDNVNGNVFGIKYPDNTVTSFGRNTQGNINLITLPDNKTVTLQYNQYGNLSQYGYTNSPNQVKAYYNAISNIDSIVDARKIATQFIFDKNDNLKTKIDDVNGLRETTSYNYDKNENLESIVDAESHTTTLKYDPSNDDLIEEWDAENKFKKWIYNEDGSLKSFKFKNGTTYTYDYYPRYDRNEGKLRQDDYNEYSYDYQSKDLIFINKTGGKQIIVDRDELNRVSGYRYNDYAENASTGVRYLYDDNNNIKRITYPLGYFIEYSYDNRDRMRSVQLNLTSGLTELVAYDYYPSGNLKSEIRRNGFNTYYFYDSENRLDSLVHLKKNGDILFAYKYELDGNGNHISETRYGKPSQFIINNTIDTTAKSYQYDKANQLTSYNGIPWSYNGNGAHTQRTDFTYTYDQRDNMLSARVANNNQYGGNFDYEYDGMENRRKANYTLYSIDPLNNANVLLTANSTTPTQPYNMWIHGQGLVCAFNFANSSLLYYHYDSRGSTIAITDDNGNVASAYEYGTFGEVTAEMENYSQPFKYVGKYGVQTDARNLYFMRARYYNPYYGRFLSEDPQFSTNLYPYADNNPINKIDPSGKSAYYDNLLNDINDDIDNGRDFEAWLGIISAMGYKAGEYALYDILGGIVLKGVGKIFGSLVEKSWVVKTSKKGGGIKIFDPKNSKNNIRIMPGNRNSSNPSQWNPYVKYQKNGIFYDVNGNPLPNGNVIEAHIPYGSFDITKMPKF